MATIPKFTMVSVKTTNGGAGIYMLLEDYRPTFAITVARRNGASFSIPGWRVASVEPLETTSPDAVGMLEFSRHEADWRRGNDVRRARLGLHRAAVIETVRLLEMGALTLNDDLVV